MGEFHNTAVTGRGEHTSIDHRAGEGLTAKSAIEPLAYSIDDAAKATSLSPTFIKQEISGGRLRARKAGRRTVIIRLELERWLDALRPTS